MPDTRPLPADPAPSEAAARERARWGDRTGPWIRWSEANAASAAKLDRMFLDELALAPGYRVLDLACGAGEPAMSVARRIAPPGVPSGGRVLATDLVPGMVAGAIARARADGLAIDGVAADMTRLPLADHSIDRVTCRFGIMFVPDVPAALAEVRRVLKPGGCAGFLVWGPLADNALFAAVKAAIAAELGSDAEGGAYTPFRFDRAGAGPDTLAGLLRAAGMAAVREVAIRVTQQAPPTPEGQPPLWQRVIETTLGSVLDRQSAAVRAALDRAIAAALEPYRNAEGHALPVHVRVVVGSA